jgi:phosphate transport system permease protein
MASSATTMHEIRPQGRISFVRRVLSGDNMAQTVAFICATLILVITAALVFELWVHSALSREKFGFHFLATSTWDPVAGNFGALPFIYGTVVTSALALLIAVPFGVGAAIFLAELAPPKLSDAMTFLIELLAAVPSVIIGLIGFLVLVPLLSAVVPPIKDLFGDHPPFFFSGPFYGTSILAACLVLSVMIAPYIISVSREVLLAVPKDLREAALALGATRWETTWQVVVPHARRGIMGSVFLALARALGETMAVTMVVGGTPKITGSLLSAGDSMASVIASQLTEAVGNMYISSLIEVGLVLFGISIVLNAAARLMILATGTQETSR